VAAVERRWKGEEAEGGKWEECEEEDSSSVLITPDPEGVGSR